MKYKFTVLFGILFGVGMSALWATVFSTLPGASGIGVALGFGVSFAACGCLFGYAMDSANGKKRNGK